MRLFAASVTSLALLAACSPTIPDSGVGPLTSSNPSTAAAAYVPEAAPVSAQPLDASGIVVTDEGADIAAETSALLGLSSDAAAGDFAATGSTTGAPLSAMTTDSTTDLSTTALLEAAEADAMAAPAVRFAHATANAVGVGIYARPNALSSEAHWLKCAQYAGPIAAQEQFLTAGGPADDPEGLDPDGDGFACEFDPTPYRAPR